MGFERFPTTIVRIGALVASEYREMGGKIQSLRQGRRSYDNPRSIGPTE